MNQLFYLLLICVIGVACTPNNAEKDISNTDIESKDDKNQSALNFSLEIELIRYIEDMVRFDSANANTVFLIKFLKGIEDSRFSDNDTIVYISKLNNVFINDSGYKGIVYVDTKAVAIYDKNLLGNNFYDSSRIINKNIDSLNYSNDKFIGRLIYKVVKDTIYEWHP